MASLSCFSPSQTSNFLPNAKPISPRIPITKLRTPFSVSCFRPPEASIPPAVDTFWRWLFDNRVVSNKSPVKPGIGPEGLGLFANVDIAKNGVVVEVPEKYWISPDTVEASEIGSVCSELMPEVSVLLFLIREKHKGDDSFWKPYIDILPHSTNSTLFWSEGELSELQGSQLLSNTLKVKEMVKNEFLKAQEQVLIPNKRLFPSPITVDDFFWAYGMYRSRAFSHHSGKSFVLVPLADLVNHSSSITTIDHVFYSRGGLFKTAELQFGLRSPLSVKAGEQVLIRYSQNKSNADMALDYGFIESSGRFAYTLTLEIPDSDPFFGDKLKIAEWNGLEQIANFDISLGQPLPEKMLPYLRLLALGRADDVFLLKPEFRKKAWGHLEHPVNRANEEQICRVVRDACKTALSGYQTTIEEDEKLVKQNMDSKLEISVAIRLGEKRVLQQIDKIFKEKESELDALEYHKRED